MHVGGRTRLMLDVHKLFSKTYCTASWGNLTVIPGLGRRVAAGVQAAFYERLPLAPLFRLVEPLDCLRRNAWPRPLRRVVSAALGGVLTG